MDSQYNDETAYVSSIILQHLMILVADLEDPDQTEDAALPSRYAKKHIFALQSPCDVRSANHSSIHSRSLIRTCAVGIKTIEY